MIPVDDPADPRISMFVGLRDRDLRIQDGLFVAEGDILVGRAVRAGYRARSVLVDATRPDAIAGVPDDVPVYGASPELLKRITGLAVHRGCLGAFERPVVAELAHVLERSTRIAVLAGVVNPTNVGLIARSAVALGIDALVLDEDCSDPLYRRAARVSMGEIYGFPYAFVRRLPGGLDPIHDAGFTTLALTPDAEASPISALAFGPTDKVAMVLGSEGPGLNDETMAACRHRIRIPISARADSLNVGVAASIAFYEIGQPTG